MLNISSVFSHVVEMEWWVNEKNNTYYCLHSSLVLPHLFDNWSVIINLTMMSGGEDLEMTALNLV